MPKDLTRLDNPLAAWTAERGDRPLHEVLARGERVGPSRPFILFRCFKARMSNQAGMARTQPAVQHETRAGFR